MGIIKTILLIVDAVLCLALIVLMLLQSDKAEGAGSVVSGTSSSDGYLNNNKDRSRDGRLRRFTIIAGALFMIITYVLGLLYIVPEPVVEDTVSEVQSENQIPETTDGETATTETTEQ